MSGAAADRNLLLGIIALQMDFISRDALIAGMQAWVLNKATPLSQILHDQGALTHSRRALLDALVEEHLKLHEHEPEKSLAALSSIGSVREELSRIADPDLQASLPHVAAARPDQDNDPNRNIASTIVGASTSAGTRFRILRSHAKGGLGEVFVARDGELNRDVALKEIQSQFAFDPHFRSRFEFEAEVTGGLEHPGIVPIYGLGHMADGRPYYAMRFIKGDSLKEAIRRFHEAEQQSPRDPGQSTLALRELLGRFIDVCDAVAYAHSRRVLHRDLKPGNIMLGKYGETLVVDWGLAKTLDEAETEGPIERPELALKPASSSALEPTLAGSAVGTPAYMSPEQVDGRVGTLGVRSDVYCLGATLYHLLTGHAPCEAEQRGEIYQKVLAGDIPRPRSRNPRIAPALEAICLKSLARQPGDRYESADVLRVDIERWLADEPVTAWREPISIRARRWARRNRTPVTAAAVAVLAGVVGLSALAAVQSKANRDLKREKDNTARALIAETKAKNDTQEALTQKGQALAQSEEARKRAQAVLVFLEDDVLAAARPEGQDGGLGVDVTVRKAVDAAEPKIAARFKDQPIVEAEVRDTLARTYVYLREASLAIRQSERTLALLQTRLGPDHPDTLSSRNHLALAYQDAGRTEDAIKLLEATVKQQESKLGPDDPNALASRNSLANCYLAAGRTDDALKMHEATLKLFESKLGPDHPDTLNIRNNVALAYRVAGRMDDAMKMHETTVKRRESKLGPDHPDTLQSRNSLANSYLTAGRTDDAIKMLEATLKQQQSKVGPDHPDTLQSRNSLATAYEAAGRANEAIKMHEANLKLCETKLGPDHPGTLSSRRNLAAAYSAAGRTDDAIRMLEATLKLCESKLGPDHPDALQARNNLADAYRVAGRADDAIKMLEAILKQRESKLGPDHADTLQTGSNLAAAYYASGRTDDAVKLLEATVKQQESKLGPDHPATLTSRGNLAFIYQTAGRTDEAIKLHEANLKLSESKLGPDHPNTLISRGNLAKSYRAAGQLNRAVSLLEQALRGFRAKVGPDHPYTLTTEQLLAEAYNAAGRYTGAEPLLRDALERARKRFGPSDPRTAAAAASLGSSLIPQRKWAEAEPVLRECLLIRQKALPDDWTTFNTRSMLGGSLLGQKKFADAEPLIVAGYEGIKAREAKIPVQGRPNLAEAAARVVRLYEAWGKPAEATTWKSRLGLADLPADVFATP